MEFKPIDFERKWIDRWMDSKVYKAVDGDKREKSYILIEFPYPSGERLHVGHARSYCCLDAVARKRRMQGFNVLYPIGWDAFGLPAENYAIKTGIHPAITTQKNIANAKAEAISWGLSFDWDREINTTDPEYYKWTQWVFVQLFKHGLAYKAEIAVNWCPACKINLANEEVIDGNCERCGAQTERRNQAQWMLKITAYADRLLEDLKTVNFREDIAASQINWIGRKRGIEIEYPILETGDKVTVFTTRPDTNFGATFIVLAPEHPLAKKAATINSEVNKYIKLSLNKSERDRQVEEGNKTGVFTGWHAENQLTGYKMPIWVSDFVLSGFGTGALVGVPGHDLRDFDFAKTFGLKIVRVVVGKDGDKTEIVKREQVQEQEGKMVNSGFLDGMDIHKATEKIMDYMVDRGWGRRANTYHLRDWVFSRQHYWGEPMPVVYCSKCASEGKSWFTENQGADRKFKILNFKFEKDYMTGWFPVPEDQLPVKLPEVEKYQPTETGDSPLAQMGEFVNTTCPNCSGKARRETDTMPNWAGSSWYFLRYIDPYNKSVIGSKDKLGYWLPVDWYNGGMEHTTLHLLYSRFWNKFLFDLGVVPVSEPYAKRTSHGVILGPDGRKMSKSKGNVINPDEVVAKYGADTLRLYEMFVGPFDQTVAWSWESLEGVYRFLKRVWKLVWETSTDNNSSEEANLHMARLVNKVDTDLESMKFNTAVAALMEFVNWWSDHKKEVGPDLVEVFIRVIAPLAPFMAEELWQKFGNFSVHQQKWPKLKINAVVKQINLAVMVNGKVRGVLEVETQKLKDAKTVEKMAMDIENVKKFVVGKEYKVVYVPNKIINFATVHAGKQKT